MDNSDTCKEKVGLFLVNNCPSTSEGTCENCGKHICKKHTYSHSALGKQKTLCLSCKASLDSRLTSEIELYSPERAIWRKKMMNRFMEEYPFLVTMTEQYGSLFDTIILADYVSSSNHSSSFDS
ncbi:hypothetical protein ETU09_02925 [Apibacter muscae]|uniref:Uncharacterized protein n=1 Tax=Apibacter muscae TaxID=2509004 RepID=A0A563DHX5_9FLAO|nr:hypothetical protein [Apibacter muscae]TWP29414.1 hypothetical protein ETU09_02925 [Apibacter muscae]